MTLKVVPLFFLTTSLGLTLIINTGLSRWFGKQKNTSIAHSHTLHHLPLLPVLACLYRSIYLLLMLVRRRSREIIVVPFIILVITSTICFAAWAKDLCWLLSFSFTFCLFNNFSIFSFLITFLFFGGI